MDNIFLQLVALYKEAADNLSIGYSLKDCKVPEMWELMQILMFIESGYATKEDLAFIGCHYTVNPKLLDINTECERIL